jgi:hypothetical protein
MRSGGLRMPKLAGIVLVLVAAAAPGSNRAQAQSCADDYVTIENIRGIIIDIKPAPEPFRSADIYISGPAPCTRIWMQVLKSDAEKCRIGGEIELRGVVTSDSENHDWEIGPVQNEYMTLGDDFTCS